MKQELKTPLIVVIAIVAVAIAVWVGSRTIGGAGDLDQGQIKYTPGKPPWEETDPSKQGPGAGPGAPSAAGGPPPGGNAPGGPPPGGPGPGGPGPGGAPNLPPGMSAPVLGNSGK